MSIGHRSTPLGDIGRQAIRANLVPEFDHQRADVARKGERKQAIRANLVPEFDLRLLYFAVESCTVLFSRCSRGRRVAEPANPIQEEFMTNSHWRCIRQVSSLLIASACFANAGIGSAAKPAGEAPLTYPRPCAVPAIIPRRRCRGRCRRTCARQVSRVQLQPAADRPKQGRRRELADRRVQGSRQQPICALPRHGVHHRKRTHVGVPVIDVTDNANPTPTAYSHHDLDARSLGVVEGQRATPAACRGQRP